MPSNRDYKAPGVFAEDASTTIPPVPITGASYREPDSDQNIGNGWPFGQLVNSARFNQIMYKLTRLIKGVDEQGILSWSSATDYGVDAVVTGSDGQEYVSILASGPSGAGAQDPVSAPTYWRTKAATQEEADAGVNDRYFITPNKLRFGFSISLSQNGYITLPTWVGGLIIQWGTIETPDADIDYPVLFPIAFPNECFSVNATFGYDGPRVQDAVSVHARSITESGFIATRQDIVSTTSLPDSYIKFIAIGF